jgi:hypothetical protein
MNTPTRTVALCRADDFTPHPELIALLGEPADDEVCRISQALQAGRRPDLLVEITPQNQVIFGYPAVLASLRAGLHEIEVIVHDNLQGQHDAVVSMAVIDAALEHGGLDKLGVTRCLRRAHQLRSAIPYETVREYQKGDLLDQVTTRLSVSKRNGQRYLRLLDAPQEVQQAYADKKLSLTVAERAAGLSLDKKAELAAAIQGGEEPQKAVARFVKTPTGRHKQAYGAWLAFVKDLQRGLADMDGRFCQVRALSPEEAALVDRAIAELQALRASALIVNREQQAANLQALLAGGGQQQLRSPS